MQALTKRHIKSGAEYNGLFPKANMEEITVQKNANVGHTVKFIPQVVSDTLFHTAKIARLLKGETIKDTCNNIWDFVYTHINYKKDEDGKEQVRSPARAWADRHTGVDCDCYTVFISSILSNLNIPHLLRIAKYSADHFQHIYPVAVDNRHYLILECVGDRVNYEEPYSEKKDFTMDLNYLNGVPSNTALDSEMEDNGSGLGKLFDFLKKKRPSTSSGEKKEGKLKTFFKKALNVINKVNPATVLLRAGVLAAMKLNFLKVPQRLKYAYLSDAEAQKRGVDTVKFQKLKHIKDKIKKIYYGAGGKPENLREAILKGKGNENREVPMSGFMTAYDIAVTGMDEKTPLTKLLGQEMYYSEFMNGTQEIEGLGSLGEPATGTAIAAASGVMAAIAALLKNLGNLFPGKKDKEAKDFENTTDADKEAEKVTASEQTDLDKLSEELEEENKTTRSLTTTDTTTDSTTGEDKPPAEDTFWNRNKKWLKPTLIGTGVVATLGLGYFFLRPKKKQKPLEGLQSKKRGRKKGSKNKLKTIELK